MYWLRLLCGNLVLLCALLAQSGMTSALGQQPEKPLGVIVEADNAVLVAFGTELPLTARPGDLLFPGDSLRLAAGSATFLFCPDKSSNYVSGSGTLTIQQAGIDVGPATLSKSPTPVCELPAMERNRSASERDAAAPSRGSVPPGVALEARLSELSADKQAIVRRELASVQAALATNPRNLGARIGLAEILARHGLAAEAVAEYQRILSDYPDAMWTRSRLLVLESEATPVTPSPKALTAGKVYALLIGISKYENQTIAPLQFAHEDAALFAEHLRSPRGGSVPLEQLTVLANEQATQANIIAAFERLKQLELGQNDKIVILFAAHGTAVSGTGRRAQGYLVTYDSDPQDLKTTGIAMQTLREFIERDLERVGLVTAFVDVCRSGMVGILPSGRIAVENQLGASEGELFLFTASGAKEASIESAAYGGGHGAFSYFLADALNGAADRNQDNFIVIDEVVEYVRTNVINNTNGRQRPNVLPGFDGNIPLVDVRRNGIALKRLDRQLIASAAAPGSRALQQFLIRDPGPDAPPESRRFEEALAAGRILPDAPESAFAALREVEPKISREEYADKAGRLRSALETMGQQVMLRYLSGDQVAQTHRDFLMASGYFSAAKLLSNADLFLESRELFCLGRAAVFDKDYRRAIALLERSVRLDPDRGYAYNGLGITYLEQARYADAVAAFREAARRAPQWAYPLHNLALTYTQIGDYDAAIRAYEQAIQLAAKVAYLPYNLGVLYQRLNRNREAETYLRAALMLDSVSGEPDNALGALYAAVGKRDPAERWYREALRKNAGLLAARHNLAALLARDKSRLDEALKLLETNTREAPDYIASRISLARVLTENGRIRPAIDEYKNILSLRPEYVAAREALGHLYRQTGEHALAVAEYRRAIQQQPDSAVLYETLGELYLATGQNSAAAAAYADALSKSSSRKDRKRIEKKLRSVENRGKHSVGARVTSTTRKSANLAPSTPMAAGRA